MPVRRVAVQAGRLAQQPECRLSGIPGLELHPLLEVSRCRDIVDCSAVPTTLDQPAGDAEAAFGPTPFAAVRTAGAFSELAVQELVTITGLQQSRVSNHLSLLKRAGLVRDRREGSWSVPLVGRADRGRGALTPSLFRGDGAVRTWRRMKAHAI